MCEQLYLIGIHSNSHSHSSTANDNEEDEDNPLSDMSGILHGLVKGGKSLALKAMLDAGKLRVLPRVTWYTHLVHIIVARLCIYLTRLTDCFCLGQVRLRRPKRPRGARY